MSPAGAVRRLTSRRAPRDRRLPAGWEPPPGEDIIALLDGLRAAMDRPANRAAPGPPSVSCWFPGHVTGPTLSGAASGVTWTSSAL